MFDNVTAAPGTSVTSVTNFGTNFATIKKNGIIVVVLKKLA